MRTCRGERYEYRARRCFARFAIVALATKPLGASTGFKTSKGNCVISLARTLVTVFLVSLSPLALAAPCAGFTDVDDSSPFCADVTWIANRGITLGCDVGLYCPNAAVTRLAMAAFLHRLGELLPDAYPRQFGTQVTQTTPLAPGASETWFTFGWPVQWHMIWRALPSTTGSRLAITNQAIENNGNGTLTYHLTVQNQGTAGVAYTLGYSVLR